MYTISPDDGRPAVGIYKEEAAVSELLRTRQQLCDCESTHSCFTCPSRSDSFKFSVGHLVKIIKYKLHQPT